MWNRLVFRNNTASSRIRSTRSYHPGVRYGCTKSSAEADGDFTSYHHVPRYESLLSIAHQVFMPPCIEWVAIVLITAAAMKLNVMAPAGRVWWSLMSQTHSGRLTLNIIQTEDVHSSLENFIHNPCFLDHIRFVKYSLYFLSRAYTCILCRAYVYDAGLSPKFAPADLPASLFMKEFFLATFPIYFMPWLSIEVPPKAMNYEKS